MPVRSATTAARPAIAAPPPASVMPVSLKSIHTSGGNRLITPSIAWRIADTPSRMASATSAVRISMRAGRAAARSFPQTASICSSHAGPADPSAIFKRSAVGRPMRTWQLLRTSVMIAASNASPPSFSDSPAMRLPNARTPISVVPAPISTIMRARSPSTLSAAPHAEARTFGTRCTLRPPLPRNNSSNARRSISEAQPGTTATRRAKNLRDPATTVDHALNECTRSGKIADRASANRRDDANAFTHASPPSREPRRRRRECVCSHLRMQPRTAPPETCLSRYRARSCATFRGRCRAQPFADVSARRRRREAKTDLLE